MATQAISAEYEADAKDFASEIVENGYQCSFGSMGESSTSYGPPGGYQEIGKASVLPSEWSSDFSADVRTDDAMFFVEPFMHMPDGSTKPLDAEPFTRMIDSNGDERTLIKLQAFRPDGVTAIYFEMQVR